MDTARRVLLDTVPGQFGFHIATLGRAQLVLAQHAECERSFLEAFSAYSGLEGTQNTFYTEAIAGLLTMNYTAWHAAEPDAGHDVQAAEWRERLDAGLPEPADSEP
jgi:hypothetical protein